MLLPHLFAPIQNGSDRLKTDDQFSLSAGLSYAVRLKQDFSANLPPRTITATQKVFL
jgi:hypothetical protein